MFGRLGDEDLLLKFVYYWGEWNMDMLFFIVLYIKEFFNSFVVFVLFGFNDFDWNRFGFGN